MVKLRFQKGGRSGSYVAVIPKDIVRALGWAEGLELDVRILEVEGKKAVALVPRSTG